MWVYYSGQIFFLGAEVAGVPAPFRAFCDRGAAVGVDASISARLSTVTRHPLAQHIAQSLTAAQPGMPTHGETAWNLTGQHTGNHRTVADGGRERNARRPGTP